jgi:type I restriction enzyme M protein
MHRPSWFRDDKVLISNAETVGINKDGEELYLIDQATGQRTETINDQLARDVAAVLQGEDTPTLHWVDAAKVKDTHIAVPVYYDERPLAEYTEQLTESWPNFRSVSLGELIDDGQLLVRRGHGSPSADLRSGTIPYIKVSDLRAGQININPTNRVTEVVARRHWGGGSSGLEPFDLITPARTSKNIGDFAVLMPGQERIVLTREMLILRPTPNAPFDSFFLLWAMSLKVVRHQWRRIIFMQTNREDTGERFREIAIPVAPSSREAEEVAKPFRDYYEGTASLRKTFLAYLTKDDHHHVFLASVEAVEEEAEAEEAATTEEPGAA